MERKDIENMAGLMIADAMKPVMMELRWLREHVLKMDGNGGPTKGSIQRQDDKIAELHEELQMVGKDVKTLITTSETISKAALLKWICWGVGTMIAMGMLILGIMGYRASHHLSPMAAHRAATTLRLHSWGT